MINLYLHGLGSIKEDNCTVFKVLNNKNIPIEIIDFQKIFQSNNLTLETIFSKNIKIDNLIGYSIGGAIAIEYTYLYPEKIKSLILIDPIIKKIKNYPIKLIHRLYDSIISNGFKDTKTFFFKNFKKYRIIYNELKFLSKIHIFYDKDYLIENNTIFLWGEKDRTCPIKDYQAIKSNFQNHELIKIPGGHEWIKEELLLEKYLIPIIK